MRASPRKRDTQLELTVVSNYTLEFTGTPNESCTIKHSRFFLHICYQAAEIERAAGLIHPVCNISCSYETISAFVDLVAMLMI